MAIRSVKDDTPDQNTIFDQASILDLINEDVKQVAETKEVHIPIVGYEKSGLAVKYHMPESGKELDKIATKVQREFKDRFSRNLYSAIDTMILLCGGLYVCPDEIDKYVELDPQLTGSPVCFDERLAEALGFEGLNSARSILKKMFGNNDIAIMNHAEKLSRWLQNSNADLSLEFGELGE